MIPEGFITGLLERADIVDVINRYVPLKKAGRNWMCCCPFHKEKTPSFSVSQTKQFFKCFGCGEAGNAIGFIMKYEGLEFPDAVRKLAGYYSMEVPEWTARPQRQSPREGAHAHGLHGRGRGLLHGAAQAERWGLRLPQEPLHFGRHGCEVRSRLFARRLASPSDPFRREVFRQGA